MSSEPERWTGESIFTRWAPDGAPWSPWVKPVLFAEMRETSLPPLPSGIASEDVAWAPETTAVAIAEDDAGYRAAPARRAEAARDRAALVIDLVGAASVHVGLALIARGYRPVPLFNGASGGLSGSRVLDVARAIAAGTRLLEPGALPHDAPPAFLVDSQRSLGVPVPGQFDGRWIVFPQDFPSANALRARGIERVVWRATQDAPDEDLAHVMLAWQRQGVAIWRSRAAAEPTKIEVQVPRGFRSILRRAAVIAGLRRNATGGFGAMVPVPSQSSGYG